MISVKCDKLKILKKKKQKKKNNKKTKFSETCFYNLMISAKQLVCGLAYLNISI